METSDILKSRGDTEKPDEVDNIMKTNVGYLLASILVYFYNSSTAPDLKQYDSPLFPS
jgi:hypothetical protein